jgi:hypothetical protein
MLPTCIYKKSCLHWHTNKILSTCTCQWNAEYQYVHRGHRWFWSYSSWIYNYLCNQYLSPLTLWVRILLRWGVLDATLKDKVCQWLMTGQWVSSTNKTDHHYITEILLKVALSIIDLKPNLTNMYTYKI